MKLPTRRVPTHARCRLVGMGPVLIFDKSALQGLSLDEAVWLEAFFLFNITPVFFVETLADLSKTSKRRTAEAVVADIAGKTPRLHTWPNLFHLDLIGNDLLGNHPPMNGQVVVVGGEAKRSPDGKVGHHFAEFDETAALARWQEGRFHELERDVAVTWRNTLSNVDFGSMIEDARSATQVERARTLDEVYEVASEYVDGSGVERVEFARRFLGIGPQWTDRIAARYAEAGDVSLQTFAPYTAFVLKVSLFFYIGMGSNLIGRERKSNMVDVSYLYYLPFCQVFASSDKLHRTVAPYFLGSDRRFLDGRDLKAALREIVRYGEEHMTEIEEMGIVRFARRPPNDLDNALTQVWDAFRPGWRDAPAHYKPREHVDRPGSMTAEALRDVAEKSVPVRGPSAAGEPDYTMFVKKIAVRRGRWRMVPPEAEPPSQGS